MYESNEKFKDTLKMWVEMCMVVARLGGPLFKLQTNTEVQIMQREDIEACYRAKDIKYAIFPPLLTCYISCKLCSKASASR